MEKDRSSFKNLTGSSSGKRPLGRRRRKWEDNIRMDLKEIDIHMRNWVNSGQDRDYWSPSKCAIEPPGFISHGVSYLKYVYMYVYAFLCMYVSMYKSSQN